MSKYGQFSYMHPPFSEWICMLPFLCALYIPVCCTSDKIYTFKYINICTCVYWMHACVHISWCSVFFIVLILPNLKIIKFTWLSFHPCKHTKISVFCTIAHCSSLVVCTGYVSINKTPFLISCWDCKFSSCSFMWLGSLLGDEKLFF